MKTTQWSRLRGLLSEHTAPFRETHIIRYAEHYLADAKIPYFKDPTGNIVVGPASATEYRKLVERRSSEPVRLFIAHMDHPGFHGWRWLGDRDLKVRWLGGSPVKFIRGATVWIGNEAGVLCRGHFKESQIAKHGRGLDSGVIRLEGTFDRRRAKARDLFGGFDFRRPVWLVGRRIYTRAADDLIGVFCLLETARTLFASKGKAATSVPFLGVLTRAEEVGFVGAVAHFQLNWLAKARRPVVAVSLEASRTLPGAAIGKGPVVRLGDRRTVFSPDYLQVLTTLADSELPRAYQRRIMDGGACEATAATAFGIPAIGISIPLGNYHNQGSEGGQECSRSMGPAPEFVHMDDIGGMLKLCHAIVAKPLAMAAPWAETRRKLGENLARYRNLL